MTDNFTVEVLDGRDPKVLGVIVIHPDGAEFAGMKISKTELSRFLRLAADEVDKTVSTL